MADILLRGDGGYYRMSGLTAAGIEFVRARSTSTPESRLYDAVSIGASVYNQVLADAAAAGLVILQQ